MNLRCVLLLLGVASMPNLAMDAVPQDTARKQVLSEGDQKKLLSSRDTAPKLLGVANGTFDRFVNFYYTFKQVPLHTDDEKVNEAKVFNVFPDFYKPTHQELFMTVARQARASFRYDAQRGYWLFEPAKDSLPYKIKLAKEWKSEDRGLYVKYTPPTALVGMDIYILGNYSADKEEEKPALYARVREAQALKFCPLEFVKVQDMTTAKVDGADALYYETSKVPRPNNTWRQWMFVKDGSAFGIASSIDKDHEVEILPDVQAMVASFKLLAKRP
jgi:hypothetical protein